MQPSSKYESTEKTYAGGFVYKETNSTFSSIYALDDAIDMSVSYTTPINSNFNKVNMGGWNSNSSAAYVSKRQRFRKEWTQSGGGKAYSNVNGLAVSKSPFASDGNVTIVFSNGSGNKYYFGKSAQASATVGTFGQKLITDFEVNKVIFRITLLTGWTKAEFDYFKSNGSLQDSDGSNINVSDFIDNPSNYYIRTFDVAPVAYWDGSTWKGNNLSNSPNIHINFLIDTAKVSGICNIQKHHFDNASGTGSYGVSNFSVYNSTSGNTTEIASSVRGAVVSELQNVGSGMGGFVLDSATDPLELDPDLTGDEMTNMCDSGIVGAGDTLPAHNVSMCSALTVLKYDQYTLSYDVGSSGQTHFSRYNFYLCTGMKGEYVDKLFAYAGVYFYNGSLTDLIDSGATPTNLKVTGMRLGEMNSAGQTTGNWINPNQMDDYVGPNKDGSIIHPNYNPQPPTPPSPSGDDMDSMTTGFASSLNGCAKYYLMSPSDMRDLITDFYTHAFAGSSMSESIISCHLCGIEPSFFLAVSDAKIKIPTLSQQTIFESDAEYSEITAVNNLIPVGHINVPRLNHDFHDFTPYSIYEVFIPYCGWCSLPDTVAGRTIWVEYHVDIRTMSGKGIVLVQGDDEGKATCAEMAMNFGVTSPFAVIEAGLARQAAVTAGIQTAVGFASGVVGALSGHNALTVSGVGNAIQGCANGAMSSMTNYTQVQGKAGDTSDFANGRQCYLKISWSKTDEVVNNSMFGHTIGYLCNEVGQLSNYSGFTVCLNPHITGIDCTDDEKEEIKRMLENGVIL